MKEWRGGEAVRYNGSSHEEGLSRVGRALSRSRTGSDLCYSSFPLAENGVKGRKDSSRMASEQATALVQAGHEGGGTDVVAVERPRWARFWIC